MLGLVYWYFKWVSYNHVFSSRCVIVFGGLSYRCHCLYFLKRGAGDTIRKISLCQNFCFCEFCLWHPWGIVLNWSNNLFIMAVGQFGTRTFWHRTIWHQERIYVLIIVRQYNFLHIVSKSKKNTQNNYPFCSVIYYVQNKSSNIIYFLIVGKISSVKSVYYLYLCPTVYTNTPKLNLCPSFAKNVPLSSI